MEHSDQEHDVLTPHDSALLTLLREGLDHDAEIDSAIAFGIGVFPWRTIEMEIALLDVANPKTLLAVRSETPIRHLRFTTETSTIDLAVETNARTHVVRGWIAPPIECRVRLVAGDGSEIASGDSDDLGHIELEVPQGGLMRLEVLPHPHFCTEWFQL